MSMTGIIVNMAEIKKHRLNVNDSFEKVINIKILLKIN